MTDMNEVCVVKLITGEMLCGVYLGRHSEEEAPGLGFRAILLADVGSVNVGRDRSDPTKLTYFLVPWQTEVMHIANDKIVAIGAPNALAAKEHERVFRRIVTPDINEVAALQRGPHGKM